MHRPRPPYVFEHPSFGPRLSPASPYHFRGHNLHHPPPQDLWWGHPYHQQFSAPPPPYCPPPLPPPPPSLFNGARGQWGGVGKGTVDKKVPHLFSCQACNREYKSQETYQEHVQGHVKCSQCDFNALPKVVKEHSVVHFLPDFLKFTTPEDTQRWRNERKKNYPTISNVAKKKQQDLERKDRRQVLDTPLYRYVSKLLGEPGPSFQGKCGGQNWKRGSGKGKWQATNKRKMNFQSESGADIEAMESKELGEKCNKSRRLDSNRKTKNHLTSTDVAHCQPTLLQMLLRDEIRHEHNTILQCVHYIVNHNFWDEAFTEEEDHQI
ncbi:PREDICTED: nuclear fragile X mental retardation-interacting protein 1-like isoform X2 [Amphimedon queenslandica]|uniref:C2H2-type domain-containing protein n=1 Tax=Amphimedon queenslandica TaxID=400682 RepID=A0AAN0JLG6_AMPQE|nr:PREDICTED: nuclear fragile X mental retardation-interacting protein 1-like isoform X2 [Amphimedon queenslandica]|eukprot:XP_019857832.1 PREDICTED: nuclear fragile X mental retardation-interacting protein 1-like isoform X2 [Amphimedon queenslandica]